jgi:hypothetical protein
MVVRLWAELMSWAGLGKSGNTGVSCNNGLPLLARWSHHQIWIMKTCTWKPLSPAGKTERIITLCWNQDRFLKFISRKGRLWFKSSTQTSILGCCISFETASNISGKQGGTFPAYALEAGWMKQLLPSTESRVDLFTHDWLCSPVWSNLDEPIYTGENSDQLNALIMPLCLKRFSKDLSPLSFYLGRSGQEMATLVPEVPVLTEKAGTCRLYTHREAHSLWHWTDHRKFINPLYGIFCNN